VDWKLINEIVKKRVEILEKRKNKEVRRKETLE